jgi:hypothetical protein
MSHYADDMELVVDPDAFLERGTFKGRHGVDSGLPMSGRLALRRPLNESGKIARDGGPRECCLK